MLDVFLDALIDSLKTLPFLFAAYFLIEYLEHRASSKMERGLQKLGKFGPIGGAILGVVPQCGFSAMGATLYAGRVITLGTLVAVFLSTSDEMLPLLVAERVDAGLLAQVLLAKAAVAAVVGLAVDAALRALRRNARAHAAMRRGVLGPAAVAGDPAVEQDVIDELAEAGEGADHIHRLCEREHCGCDDDHEAGSSGHDHGHDHHGGAWPVVRSALSHTVQVTVFIFLVTMALVAVLETVGEPALEAFLSGNRMLAVFASALVGLIPNCAASVVITQLYLEGVLSFGAMLAGTLVGAGAGFLVLFRTNRSLRENVVILVALYVVGVLCGIVLTGMGM